MSKVSRIYDEIVNEDLLEDRREYDVEELMHSYDLNEDQALTLYNMIQDNFKTPERMTNVEFMANIMEFSQFGALAQAFVVEAVTRYAKQVAESTPEQFGSNGLVSPEAWIGVAKEIQGKMDAKYGPRRG